MYIESVAQSRYRPDDGVYQCVASIEGLGSIVSRKAALTLACKYRLFVIVEILYSDQWEYNQSNQSTTYHNDGVACYIMMYFVIFGILYTCTM